MSQVPIRYLPQNLSNKDKKIVSKELRKSRKAYKKGKYHTRKKVKSFKVKKSSHIENAKRIYKVDTILANRKLAKATGCSQKMLQKMIQKGQGAYFSSGSRPNQTAHSWGRARLASAITGGKASAVDYYLLKANCKKNSKALKLAKKSLKKYNYGRKRVKQVKIGGGKWINLSQLYSQFTMGKLRPYDKVEVKHSENHPRIETFIDIEEFDGSFEARFSDETSPFVFSYSDEDGEETVFRLITREAPIPGGGKQRKTKKNKEKH